MRRRRTWWRLATFWDGLCALGERGAAWILRQREAIRMALRHRRERRVAPRRGSFKPALEGLEDVLAPGTILSATNSVGTAPENIAYAAPNVSTPEPVQIIDASPAADDPPPEQPLSPAPTRASRRTAFPIGHPFDAPTTIQSDAPPGTDGLSFAHAPEGHRTTCQPHRE